MIRAPHVLAQFFAVCKTMYDNSGIFLAIFPGGCTLDTMKNAVPSASRKKDSSERVSFRLPSKLLQQADALAKENNIDRSAVIQIALTRIVKSGI